jgi:hypothetical protein
MSGNPPWLLPMRFFIGLAEQLLLAVKGDKPAADVFAKLDPGNAIVEADLAVPTSDRASILHANFIFHLSNPSVSDRVSSTI